MLKTFGLFLLLLTGFLSPAFADEEIQPPPSFLSEEQLEKHQATIERVEKYLSGLTTIVADFAQVAPDGSLSSGKFYLQRPGKMRWQYQPPTPILIVADGKEVVFYDYELEQETHIPMDSTMISFLARETISFDDKVGIREVEEAAGIIRIVLAQREKPDEGELMLEFTDKPLTIRNMVVTDATHQRTSVALNNAAYGVQLDKKLFIFMTPGKRTPRT